MGLRAFVRKHRVEIDALIEKLVPGARKRNDREREIWVLNHEGLYLWAREEGVPI